MAEGLKITLRGLGGGLTIDENGRKLITEKGGFVFQCPPLESFDLIRAFSSNNYDTVLDGEYTRKGVRKLRTWTFDTLAMLLGPTDRHGTSPSWVPFPALDDQSLPLSPAWYRDRIAKIHDAGAPFKFTAQMTGGNIGPIMSIPAILLGFTESHMGGEGDAIYFKSMAFSEWRDPHVSQRALGDKGSASSLPTSVKLMKDGTVTHSGKQIHQRYPQGLTGIELAVYFYHDPADWRLIFTANSMKGGTGHEPLIDLPKYKRKRAVNGVVATIKIPQALDESPQAKIFRAQTGQT